MAATLVKLDKSAYLAEHIAPLAEGLRSGEFVGYLAIAICPGGGCRIFQCAPAINISQSIGAVTILQHELLKDVKDG